MSKETKDTVYARDMMLRDRFAIAALECLRSQAMVTHLDLAGFENVEAVRRAKYREVAKSAYLLADALLAQREE